MLKKILSLVWIVLFSGSLIGQSYGLQFYSHEVVPEKRTSLNLTSTEPLCLKGNTNVAFDLKFVPNSMGYFGYLIRIITSNDQNIDIIYNPNSRKFTFVIGDSFSQNFTINYSKLFGEWTHFEIQFNSFSQEVLLYVDNQLICKDQLKFSNTTCCQIFFGPNNVKKFETIDVPSMKIKDISISEGKTQKYFFPLSEASGNLAVDIISNNIANINNPEWIASHHQNWKLLDSLVTKGNPSITFDKKNEILYIISIDSLYQFSFKENQLSGFKLAKSMVNLHPGNQSVFDESSGKLINFFIDTKLVTTFNEKSRTWNDGSLDYKLTAFWQANKFISSVDSALYILGGYGFHQYKNQVQRYHIPNKNWEIIQPKGDSFMPRYLAALGTNNSADTAFIIGGYGSKSGDQILNPKYNYELMAYSVRNRSFKHIYDFKQPKNEFCFSNSIVIDSANNHFYGLIHPIDRFNSSLQLIRGSLRSPEYEVVGDEIPYLFHDIESFSDLYYCPTSQKLVAVTILSRKNHPANIKVFTIDFPPTKLVPTTQILSESNKWYWLFAISIFVLLFLSIYLFLNKKKQRNLSSLAPLPPSDVKKHTDIENLENLEPISPHGFFEKEEVTSSIFLFGNFEVIDKDSQDITRQFTPLLKEMFLLILFYTLKDNKGISSDKLYETLWEDKPLKDARNNFSVNIVKLKSILEKVGETNISKDSGKWRFEILNESIKLDYIKFISLANNKQDTIDKDYIKELLTITNKGSFLREVQYSWLDDFKSNVTYFITTTIMTYITKSNIHAEPDLILKLTNCIFHFDQMNEEALSIKCRCLIILGKHALAKETYINFSKEYKKNYGEEFVTTYNEIIGHQ